MNKMLPAVVYQMCVHGGLLVGSYAKKLCGDDVQTNDYDILVPHHKWQVVSLLIPMNARPNKFGGWRFNIVKDNADIEVDVWPGSLDEYLSNCKTKYGGRVCAVDFINNKAFYSEVLRETY